MSTNNKSRNKSGVHWAIWIPAVIVILGAVWGVLRYTISSEVAKQLAQPNQDIAVIKQELQDVQGRVTYVENRMDNLTPSTLDRLIPKPSPTTSAMELTEDFRKASDVIDVAMRAKIPASVNSLNALLANVDSAQNIYKNDAALRTASTRVSIRLSAYQDFSAQVKNGVDPISKPGVPPRQLSLGTTLMGFTFNCKYPTAHFLNFENLTEEFIERSLIFDVAVDGCAQILDGPKWIDTSFNGATVEYKGGPLQMTDVTFTNCKFNFAKNANGMAALNLISKNQGKPVTISLSVTPF